MTMEDIRLEGKAGPLGTIMTAVVMDSLDGKEYRLPTEDELHVAAEPEKKIQRVFAEIPYGIPDEPTPKGGGGAARAFSVDGYGFDRWSKLFTARQLLALGIFVKHTREFANAAGACPNNWKEATGAFLAICVDRIATDRARFAIGTLAIKRSLTPSVASGLQ